jgi:hypothetical protein
MQRACANLSSRASPKTGANVAGLFAVGDVSGGGAATPVARMAIATAGPRCVSGGRLVYQKPRRGTSDPDWVAPAVAPPCGVPMQPAEGRSANRAQPVVGVADGWKPEETVVRRMEAWGTAAL